MFGKVNNKSIMRGWENEKKKLKESNYIETKFRANGASTKHYYHGNSHTKGSAGKNDDEKQ
jgi:hypothetical protein